MSTQASDEDRARALFGLEDFICWPNHPIISSVAKEFAAIRTEAYAKGRAEALAECIAAQPCTAERPNEDGSGYQRGRFDGVMDYGRAIRQLRTTQ